MFEGFVYAVTLILSLIGLASLFLGIARGFASPPERAVAVIVLSEQEAELQLRGAIFTCENVRVIAVCDEICEKTLRSLERAFWGKNISFCTMKETLNILRNI